MFSWLSLTIFLTVFAASMVLAKLCVIFGARLVYPGEKPTPRIGGLAIITVWWIAAAFLGFINPASLLPLLLTSIIILGVGYLDARRPLGHWVQLLTQILIAIIAVFWGNFSIDYITNPFGGLVYFNTAAFWNFVLIGDILSVIWIVAMMNVINFLDGMDGLAGSVAAVALIAIGYVSILPSVNDPATALAAFSAAAAIAGFLFWNLPPAKLILGTTGSWFLGFLIAILAIQGTTKVATTAVVGAVPLIDALIVIIGRLRHKRSPFRGDLTHLHHRLKRRGLTDKTILLIYVSCSVFLGLAAVILQTQNKVILFVIFGIGLVVFVIIGSQYARRKMLEK